jgi:phospholipid/cholesterol/gamma-HCH transport system ATP-binding protein
MDIPLIEFQDVTKRFGDRTVLDRVNLKIYEGEVTTIIGLSGGGKSVLLKHIIGLLKPDEGTILFRGKPLNGMSKKERYAALGRMSYMFQDNALFDSMTVYENIARPLQETMTLKKKEIERRVMARIEQTELIDAVHKYPSELSGGMQETVPWRGRSSSIRRSSCSMNLLPVRIPSGKTRFEHDCPVPEKIRIYSGSGES